MCGSMYDMNDDCMQTPYVQLSYKHCNSVAATIVVKHFDTP